MNRKLAIGLTFFLLLAGLTVFLTLAQQTSNNSKTEVRKDSSFAFNIHPGLGQGYVAIDVQTSSKSEMQIREPWSESIQLFYVNERGEHILLPRPKKDEDDEDEIANNVDNWVHGSINFPSKICLWYSGDNVDLIETHPILCRIAVYNPATKETFKVESPTKELAPLIPGNSVFRTFYDGVLGRFHLTNGNRVDILYWPSALKGFTIALTCLEEDNFLREHHVNLQAGEFNKSFDNYFEHDGETPDRMGFTIGELTREQLGQIASAHEAVFEVEKSKRFVLDEDQLAQVRQMLTYLDSQPTPSPASK